MNIKVKKLRPGAVIPFRGSEYAAGYDLHSLAYDVMLQPGETFKFITGLAIEIPDGYFGAIFARSGLATKQGVRPANCVGVIDSDYRGEILVPLHNDSGTPQLIHQYDRIAQLVIIPYLNVNFDEVEELAESKRDTGGFGSSGK